MAVSKEEKFETKLIVIQIKDFTFAAGAATPSSICLCKKDKIGNDELTPPPPLSPPRFAYIRVKNSRASAGARKS